MKIVHITQNFPPPYEGLGIYCHHLSKHLAERGHQVEILTSRIPKRLSTQERIDGFKIHRCPYFGSIGNNRITFILKKLMQLEADVVHAHSYIFLTSNQASLAKIIKKQKLIQQIHGGMDIVLPNEHLLTRIKFGVIKSLYDKSLGKITLKLSDVIATTNNRDMEIAIKKFNIDKKFFRLIPNAIDLNEIHISNLSNKNNVVFIGSLNYGKGIETLLKITRIIAKEQSEIVFTFIGEGPLRERIEEFINSHKVNIKILGQISHKNVLKLLSNASILILPSYTEALPTVILEALASKVPVVASNVGGIPEAVINGETGCLVQPGNAYLFSEKILKLLSNESLRKKMGNNGRKLIEKHYTWDKVVKKAEKIYENIV